MSNASQNIVKTILMQAFPEEVELLGQDVVEQVTTPNVSGAVPIQLPGGHDFDLSAVMELLKNASEFAVALVTLYETLKTKGKQPTSADHLLAAAPDGGQGLTREDKLKIAEGVVKSQARV